MPSVLSQLMAMGSFSMKYAYIPVILTLATAACVPTSDVMQTPSTISTKIAVPVTPLQNATALRYNEVVPSPGSRHVTVHPHIRLQVSNCSRVISMAFSTTHNYPNTMVALKNRASVAGANALAVTNWIESGSHTYMDAHFYYCPSKRGL